MQAWGLGFLLFTVCPCPMKSEQWQSKGWFVYIAKGRKRDVRKEVPHPHQVSLGYKETDEEEVEEDTVAEITSHGGL